MCTAINVTLDEKDAGLIVLSPYCITVKNIEKGKHTLKLTLYGSRYNTFGPLHDATKTGYAGPYSWRKSGDDFSYDYVNLHPYGIMSAPEFFSQE